MADKGRGASEFGSCCDELKEVVESSEFDPLIAVGDNGILYMSIGMLQAEEGEANVVDHPVFFCPFCGTQVQTVEDIEAKLGSQPGGES